MKVCHSPHFRRAYEKLSIALKLRAEAREIIFKNNPFDPRLKTHKLHGKYSDYWAFSVTSSYRIMFIFSGKDQVVFIDIDDHGIYR